MTQDPHNEKTGKVPSDTIIRLADRFPDMLYRMSLPDRRYEYVSPASTTIFGYTPDEFLNSPGLIQEVLHPDWQAYFKEMWEALLAGEIPPYYEYQIVHRKTGKTRTLHQRNVLILDDAGQPTAIEGLVTDITAQKRIEEALHKSETRFRELVETSSDWIWEVDAEGYYTYSSPQVETILGYRPEEIVGKFILDLMPPEEAKRIEKTVRDVMRKGESLTALEKVVLHKNGQRIIIETSSIPFLDEDKKIAGFRGMNRDITERRQLDEERERARGFLQTVIDGFPERLMVISRDYTITLANRAVREGMQGEDPVAACLKCHQVSHNFTTPCEGLEDPCPLELVLESRAPVIVEHLHYDSSGNDVFVEVTAAPIFNDEGEVIQIIESCRDITGRKRAEEERLSLERQVQHAQKLESLGVLAGGIAHDFNNLLMAILGNADLALDDLSPHAPAHECIQEIEKASKRAAELAKQMLAYSGKGRFVIEPIDLNEFVDEMAHLLEVSVSKKALLKYNYADNLPAIDADATQVRQIIMNLITNASEAIGDRSGVIALSTGAMDCDRAYLDSANNPLRASLDEPLLEGVYTYFEVADTGGGMDKETQEKIFDPFFTTKFTGRGLGMAAVLGIVRGHHGTIKV